MLSQTLSIYRDAYRGLSLSTWWLSFVMLINRSGTMVVPFMTIYLTSPSMGYSIGKAGIVMGLFGAGAILGGFLGGRITDRAGFYAVQLFTLTGGGILFIVLGQMHRFPMICLVTFLLSLVNEAFRPANATAIAFYSEEQNRTRSYSLNRLAVNLGWAVGGALGGIIASVSFKLLFWVDGITNISAAILMFYCLRPHQHISRGRTGEKNFVSRPAHKDWIFLWFFVLVILFGACFFQLFTTLTAFFRNQVHFSSAFIGMLMALNGLVITFIEMVIVFRLEGRKGPVYYISRGVFLCALAYLLLIIFPVHAATGIIMILMITFGEILSMPFMNTFWISRTTEYNRGQYAGMYAIAWSAAQTFGPVAGAQLAEHAGWKTLWLVTGITLILTSTGFFFLHRHISRRY